MFLPRAVIWRLWARAAIVFVLAWLVQAALNAQARAAPMRASYYGAESGRFNADGSRFMPLGLTAAHRSLPFGTRLAVCLRGCVTVIVRDRGPAAWTGRSLDLSRGAARAIGLEHAGVAVVDVTLVGRGPAFDPRRRSRDRRVHHHHHR